MTGPDQEAATAVLSTAAPRRPAGGKLWLPAEARALRARFPSRTVAGTWDATCLDRDALMARSLAPPFALDNPGSRRQRRLFLIRILDWLQAQPGQTWQDRWNASGVDTAGPHRTGKSSPRHGWPDPAVPLLARRPPTVSTPRSCSSSAVTSSAPAFPGC
jgi:hypothetical protein